MKMEKQHIFRAIVSLSVVALPFSMLNAQQDTVKTIHESTKTEHDEVIKETKVQEPKVNGRSDTKEPERILHRGEVGFRFMPTFTALSFNTYDDNTVQGDITVTYGYGVMFGFNFSRNIGLQAEVNYSAISQKYKEYNLEREVHIDYLDVPILLSLNTDKTRWVNLNVVAGPQFGINVGSSITAEDVGNSTNTLHAVVAVKQGDIGLAYGAGLEFALTRSHLLRFDLGYRGMYGFVDMNSNSPEPNTYNVLVKASRKSNAGYAGLTFTF
jgi:opacity protein-like surface antigen